MILFYFREVLKAVSHARLAFILSLITTFISVVLITFSVFLLRSSGILEKSLKEKIVITLFLNESENNFDPENIKQVLSSKKFVSSLRIMDKEEAAAIFIKETGENFREVLDYNPLPASVEVRIKPEFLEKTSLESIAGQLKAVPGVEDVVFQSEVLYKLLDIISKVKSYFMIAALFLMAISFYLVYSTNTLIINSKRKEFEAMKLVGAKLTTIKMPILLNGMLIGIIASVFSLILFYAINNTLSENLFSFGFDNILFIYFVTVFTGPLIASLASLLAVQKITLKLS